MTRRFVIAGMLHETNTFSPVATPLAAFFSPAARDPLSAADGSPMLTGQAAIDAFAGTNIAFAAFLQAAAKAGAEVDVPLYANASPSAPTDRVSFDAMCDAIVTAIGRGCDAVMLDLHGAMVAEGFDDGEAELLRRPRCLQFRLWPVPVRSRPEADLSTRSGDGARMSGCALPVAAAMGSR